MEHVILAAEEANQFQEEPEIVTDEDENRKITAIEVIKKLMKWKLYRKRPFEHDLEWVNWKCGANEAKNQKESDIRGFFRSQKIFDLHCLL